ncbi:hypothetical protein [Serratia marcescens]|uniref:hypothetical protein n=1 Tax=Serratia marcescens TaxID=615 RepID=UPI0033267431
MSQTRDQQAYQRGVKAARLWKRLKGTVLRWDHACVSGARKHKLPGWIGHIAITLALIGSATAILFGSIVIVGAVLFIWAIAFILQNIGENQVHDYELDAENSSVTPHQNAADYAYESAVMNNEYDGAPYKSPGDN